MKNSIKNSLILFISIFFTSVVDCISVSQNDWWKSASIYQIYPKSFKDSDGDGVGDLQGIIEKLDYIKQLGVTAIWLSPINKSPQKDQGYDISDYRDVDPLFGDLNTLKLLLVEAHKRDLKFILDFVPNHTSDEHEWFQKSVNGENGYEDYYIWISGQNGSKTIPPNNWISVFKHSAWQWSEQRQQFYLHQFLKEQPDLNYFNDAVRQEMKDILTYWLDEYNVDGVRIDAVPHLVEAKNFPDEPRTYDPHSSNIEYNYLDHIYSKNQPESYEVVYEWRSHIDSITARKQSTRVCFTEAIADIKYVIPYYGNANGSQLGAHFAFNFVLLGLTQESSAKDVANLVEEWLKNLPSIYTSNWVLGNHDNHRIATKAGKSRVDALNILAGFLPGVQITYNGEEIGMEDGEVSCDQGMDMADNCTAYPDFSRDFERTPMQWDSSQFAGFTNGNITWLPVSARKNETNVADQLNDPRSHLNIYRRLQELRKGNLKDQTNIVVSVFGDNDMGLRVVRKGSSCSAFELLLNFGNNSIPVSVSNGKLLLTDSKSKRTWGELLHGPITLEPYEVLLLRN